MESLDARFARALAAIKARNAEDERARNFPQPTCMFCGELAVKGTRHGGYCLEHAEFVAWCDGRTFEEITR
jgi:hypothetical protein